MFLSDIRKPSAGSPDDVIGMDGWLALQSERARESSTSQGRTWLLKKHLTAFFLLFIYFFFNYWGGEKTKKLFRMGGNLCGATGYRCSAFFSPIKRKSLRGDALRDDYGGVAGANPGGEGAHEIAVWLSVLLCCAFEEAHLLLRFSGQSPSEAFSCDQHMCAILNGEPRRATNVFLSSLHPP